MAVVIETALRLVFDELLKVVVAETIQTTSFKSFNTLLKRLQNTIKCIEPVFYESCRLIKVLDRPQKDIVLFIFYLKTGKKLVLESSRITFRNNYQKVVHSYKLIRLNNELLRFFQIALQVKLTSGMKIPIESNDFEEDKVDQLLLSVDFNSWFNLYDEELRLDARSQSYTIPEFINRMGQLKVLTITGHCDHPSRLHNLSSLACLSNLTTIRLEHVSVSSIQPVFALKNLKHLSFVMCEIGDALMSFTTESPYFMLVNLTHLEIDMCYDLKELPSWLCSLVHLQKLSITNCHELGVLPKGLGDLSNLERLSLHCCTKLQELPESVGSLRSLSSIDISDCLSLSALPEEIGELCGLRALKMNGCAGLQELPMSTGELSQLEEVICDEETSYLWTDYESVHHNLKINLVEDDRLDTFMKIVQ